MQAHTQHTGTYSAYWCIFSKTYLAYERILSIQAHILYNRTHSTYRHVLCLRTHAEHTGTYSTYQWKNLHTTELMFHINSLDAADILGYNMQKIYGMQTFCSTQFSFGLKRNCIHLRNCIQYNFPFTSIHSLLLLVAHMSMQYAFYYQFEYAFEFKRNCMLQNWCLSSTHWMLLIYWVITRRK